MAKPQWISASDPYFNQFTYQGEFGEENPYTSTIRGLQTPELWQSVARSLGYSGPFETQVISSDPGEGGGGLVNVPAPEFEQFIAQKKAEGYDFVTKGDRIDNANQTIGLMTPTGEVVAQREAKAAGFGEFFKEFVLPAAGIAFGMGGLNSLMGGAGAGANALSGAGLGAMEGVGLSGNIINAATGQTIASLPTAAMTAADIGRELGDVLGAASDAAEGAGGAVDAGVMEGMVPGGLESVGIRPEALELMATGAVAAGVGAKPGLTGIPYLDKAIDFVTSPAGAAIVSGVGNVVGGIAGANAAEKAAETQAGAADRAMALQEKMYQDYLDMTKDYREAGVNALGKLTRGEVLPEPGYAFRLGEGMKALERVQAARGNMLSGGALKAGQRYAQDLASQEYGNAYNRLANIAGLGQTATTQAGTAGQNYASQAGELGLQQSNALARGRVSRASSYGNALLGAAGALQDYVQAPMKEQMFRDIYGRLIGKP